MNTRAAALAGAILIGLAGAGLAACRASSDRAAMPASTVRRWHCPMHPSVVSDRPGECPICRMTLVPSEEKPAPTAPAAPPPGDAARATAPAGSKTLRWRSTMNPNEVSDHPGKDSMGMEMVSEEVTEAANAVPGRAPVRLSAARRQLIGATTVPVERAPFVRTIRAVGRVVTDETRLHHVHSKVEGYAERVFARATGETVGKGQPLLSLFSPELLASQQEYLVALRARERTAASSLPSVAGSGDELVAAARRRLELFDLTPAQIEELQRTGTAQRTITLYAPASGTILARNVQEGQRIAPQDALFDLADLSRVWVLAAVYEYELPFVKPGQAARMTLSYLPGRTFDGRVALIYPTLDPATRTAQVRVEFDNPGGTLRPEMYADVELRSALGERLSVPSDAVMDTGERTVAFVEREEGLFEPRDVRVGLRLPDRVEVLSGLSAGEKVLATANFFVDSESRLKSAVAAAAQPGGPPEAPPAASAAPPPAPSEGRPARSAGTQNPLPGR